MNEGPQEQDAEMNPRTERDEATPRGEIADTAIEGESASLASIWKCPSCGAQIQIVVAPSVVPRQPFICVDGTPMVAGEEH